MMGNEWLGYRGDARLEAYKGRCRWLLILHVGVKVKKGGREGGSNMRMELGGQADE